MASNIEDPFIGQRFGSEGQLEVIGWFGELSGSNKKYTLVCNICSKDPELYGDGRFLATKGHLQTGRIPCSCSSKYVKTRVQFEVLVRRACEGDGFTFHGWGSSVGDSFKGTTAEVLVACPLHGQLEPKSLYAFLRGNRCRECRVDATRRSNLLPDEVLIQRFRELGDIHVNTTFTRSERTVEAKRYRNGAKHWWVVTCGECGETTETLHGTLLRGGKSCSCSRHRQKLAYIHKLSDKNTPVALKFGIAKSPKRRLREQNNSSVFDVECIGVWKFQSPQDCRRAERDILASLCCAVVSRSDFEDGYTETTYLPNIDKIIEIYESYGGIRQEVSCG